MSGLMVICMSGCTPDPGTPPGTLSYAQLLDRGRPDPEKWPTYVPMSLSEKQALTRALPRFYEELRGESEFSDEVRASLLKAGLRLNETRHEGDALVILHEAGATWRGRGGYVFRRGESGINEVIVQAPHSFHDHMTGELGLKVFETSRARGFFFNTIHRYRARRGERTSDSLHPADMARATDSTFHLLSTTYLEQDDAAWVLQVHGYRSRKLDRKGIKAVVSGAVEGEATTRSVATQQTLAETFGSRAIALWPRDTDSFGALVNVLGGWCVLKAPGRFVHIELHHDLREKLLEDPAPLVQVTRYRGDGG
jgi:hypothetical protein